MIWLLMFVLGVLVGMIWLCPACPKCPETSEEHTARRRHPADVTHTQEEKRYWQQIEDLAASLNTDGCTKVSNIYVRCCDRHDIDMILRYDALVVVPEAEREVGRGYTPEGHPFLSKVETDLRYLNCMRRHSRLGYWNPVAYVRYLAVRVFGNRGKEWGNGPDRE